MRKCLTDKARLIRVPQAIQEELRKKNTSLKPDEVDRLRRVMKDTFMLSYGESDDSSDRYAFEIKDPSMPEMVERLRIHKLPDAVQDALRMLSSRHRDVLQRRFGLAGERPQTLEEIGTHLNLSRERIRQIEQEAMNVMRKSKSLNEVYEDLGQASVTVAEMHN
jgi:DNA-directed RNA polymerase sigma subunit (sigma70/sigma32)